MPHARNHNILRKSMEYDEREVMLRKMSKRLEKKLSDYIFI